MTKKRLISLDAFRGFTIMLMILVNNPGSWRFVYPPFRHAEWHGCTPTDLVFPFFLYIMGVAMAFSFARRLQESGRRWPLYRQVIKRTLILIILGLFLGLYPQFNFSSMRIPGVLQRIGLCYFFVSMIVLHSEKKGQIVWVITLLLGYWVLMTLIPFSGKEDGPWLLGSNFAQHVDNVILKGHMYKPDFDPEGLVSTIPAIAQSLCGYLTGLWIRSDHDPTKKTNTMFITANILLIVAMIWSLWMPINKQLWTSSYVLYTTGLALHLLTMSFWLIDMKGFTKWVRPFIIFGSNAILVYSASSFMASTMGEVWMVTLQDGSRQSIKAFLFGTVFQPIFGNGLGSLMFAIGYVLFWLGIMTILYKRRTFIKI